MAAVTCGRSSGSSSAIRMCRKRSTACSRRRAKAASPRRRCASPGFKGRPVNWLRLRVRPLRSGSADGMTLWMVSDVTRDRERQENIFQELQHAIDYLDHAPAGFFSVDAKGSISYLNATLASWLDYDLAQVGSGGLKIADIVSGNGAALLTTLAAAPGEVKTEVFDIDFKTRGGRSVPVRLFHKIAYRRRRTSGRLADAGAQPRARRGDRSAARRRSALHALLPVDADGDRHGRQGRAGFRAPTRCSRGMFQSLAQGRRDAARSCRWSPSATARRSKARSARPPSGRATSPPVDTALAGGDDRWARFYVSRGRGRRAATRRPRSSTRSRPPASARWRTRSTSAPAWNRSASSPAASRTISTTCCPPS